MSKDNWVSNGAATARNGGVAPTYKAPPSYQEREYTNAGYIKAKQPPAPPPPPPPPRSDGKK